MVQMELRVGLFGEIYDSFIVFSQESYGKIIYSEFSGADALRKAKARVRELNRGS